MRGLSPWPEHGLMCPWPERALEELREPGNGHVAALAGLRAGPPPRTDCLFVPEASQGLLVSSCNSERETHGRPGPLRL